MRNNRTGNFYVKQTTKSRANVKYINYVPYYKIKEKTKSFGKGILDVVNALFKSVPAKKLKKLKKRLIKRV